MLFACFMRSDRSFEKSVFFCTAGLVLLVFRRFGDITHATRVSHFVQLRNSYLRLTHLLQYRRIPEAEQKAFMEENRNDVTAHGMQLTDISQLDGVNAQFIADVDKLVKEIGDDDIVNQVRDNIYQLYLESLPQL